MKKKTRTIALQLLKKYWLMVLIGLFILSLSSIVQAAPPSSNPTVQTSSNIGMQINYPKYEYIKQNTDFRFHAHVINATALKTNVTTSCFVHLYNSTGFDIAVISPMEFESYNGIDFAGTFTPQNFTHLGYYSYVMQCNSSNEIAFVSGQLFVTKNGQIPADDNLKIFIFGIFIVALIGMILTLFINILRLVTIATTIYDVLIAWGFYLLMMFASWLSSFYMINTFIDGISGTMLSVGVWTSGILPILFFVINIFVRGIKKKALSSPQELTGVKLMHG